MMENWRGFLDCINVPTFPFNRLLFYALFLFKVGSFTETEKEAIGQLSAKDVPLAERRMWYNAMSRRMGNPAGLKPGFLGFKYIKQLG